MEEIPQWAKERAAELINAEPSSQSHYDAHYVGCSNTCIAFARYIAEHEEPPVDPDLIEARAFTAERNWQNEPRDGEEAPMVKFALAAIKRGRELAKSETSNA